jgi:hypothetical protein
VPKHIDTRLNLADMSTKGLTARYILNCRKWPVPCWRKCFPWWLTITRKCEQVIWDSETFVNVKLWRGIQGWLSTSASVHISLGQSN